MIIGVISDTHIPDRARKLPTEVVEAFKKVDMIIHAGDMAEKKVLDDLKKLCPQVVAVSGNMDPESIRHLAPAKQIITIQGHRIGITHGAGNPKNLPAYLAQAFKDDAVEAIVFGHSHTTCNEVRGEVLYFNPGSPTDTLFAPYLSYGILKVGKEIQGTIVKLENQA